MATTMRTSTPPPPSTLHTPSTPKHGKEDAYEPYSPRRKSARVSQRTQLARTPPQNSANRTESSISAKGAAYATSPPSSPQTAPKKKTPRNSPMMGGRRISGALNLEGAVSAASALGIPTPRKVSKIETQTSVVRNNGMLPTPAKTPKKQPKEKSSAIASVARNLFPIRGETVEEAMPSPKKRGRKRYTGFTLDSFEAEADGPIPIYTDSHDRVPEVDVSSSNPFYGEPDSAIPDPIKRSSKRRKVSITDEGGETIESAEHRDDGLVYVFRGKKIFRKFAEKDASESESVGDEDLDAELSAKNLDRPLTRSSIKPRLLFPTPKQVRAKESRSQVTEDEEEAITDIDEVGLSAAYDRIDAAVTTPRTPRFPPPSPPSTARVTRSKDAFIGSSPAGHTSDEELMNGTARARGRGGNLSPFDGWKQTKSVGGSKKRGGDPLIKDKSGKKTRA